MKKRVHEQVALVLAWSMEWASRGVGPNAGFRGEEFTGFRTALAGHPLADGWRFAYFGTKSDAKARKETHNFPRSYQHSRICEMCMAERPNKKGDPLLTFKNFYGDAAHLHTQLSASAF